MITFMRGSSDEPSDPVRTPTEHGTTNDPVRETAFTPREQRAHNTAPILLLSMPQMADPNFVRTVVLLCDYTDQGAFAQQLLERAGVDAGSDRAAGAHRPGSSALDWRTGGPAANVGADDGAARPPRRAA